MATHFVDPDGRSHWAEEESNFAKSGLESGHLRRASGPAPEQVDSEQVDETGEEAEDAAVEQDGDGADADGVTGGSGDAKPARRGSRRN